MEIVFLFFAAILLPILSRMSGGGMGAAKLKDALRWDGAPELLFGAMIGLFAFLVYGLPWFWGLLISAWSYACMETSHGTILQWGDNPDEARGERQHRLTPLVDLLARKFDFEKGGKNYCRLFMSVKGFLIGLPLGGLPLAVLWPLCYEVSHKEMRSTLLAEFICGPATFYAMLSAYAVIRWWSNP